ncbi:MAG: TonB-dependent receptor [bacterium]
MSNFVYSQSYDSSKFKTEEIKVYSNKILTDKFRSPTKVQVLNKIAIENKNGETLSDVLQIAGGVYVKSYGGNYSLNTISLNGMGSEHTLILLNGFKLNSSQNNQLDLNTISKDNIEQIEILNNGSSSIYGSEAIGGVVNIITKNNSINDLKLVLNGQFGSYNQRKIYLGAEKKFKYFRLGFNYSKEKSLNKYKYYFNTGSEYILKQRENSGYDNSIYSAEVSYNVKKNTPLIKYFTSFSNHGRNIPGLETGSAPSSSSLNEMNWNNILSYEGSLSKLFLFKTQINFQNNLTHYSDGLITDSYYKNIYISNSTQTSFIKRNFEIVAGYEINYSTLNSNELEDHVSRVQPAVFLVSQIDLSEALKIYPSIRIDYISDIKKNVVSGKFGINFKPFSNLKLNFKASAGNNFAAPTFNELYWKDIGNKNLKPEKAVNADFGTIYEFSLFSKNTVELTYTYINAEQKIVWTPNSNGLYTPKNIEKSSSDVLLVDINLYKIISRDISVSAGINYSHTLSIKKSQDYTNDPTYGKQIFYIPVNLAKLNLTIQYKDAGANLYYTYTGRRFINFENTEQLPAVNIVEGNIYKNFRINKLNAKIKIEVNNILDQNYQIIAGYPMPLINYKVILNIEY